MRIAVVGIGAVGGLIAARLARAGHEVSALARGQTLARIRADGIEVDGASGSFSAIGGQPRAFLASLDATLGAATPWDAEVNAVVNSVRVVPSGLVVAGDFTTISGTPQTYVAVFGSPPVAVEETPPNVSGLELSISPNPFRTLLHARFSLARPGPVELALYDLAGRRVGDFVQSRMDAGWHTVDLKPASLAKGVYWCRLAANGTERVVKLLHVD